MSKDEAGIRITLPDSMSDEDKIKSIKDMKEIIKTFEKLAGAEGTTDFSDADKKIAELSVKPIKQEDKDNG